MAEVALKINAGSGFDDGDSIQLFNNRRILSVNAQNICFKDIKFNFHGLRDVDSLVYKILNSFFQYKFERKSKDIIERIEIDSNFSEFFGSPQISVEEVLKTKLKKKNHLVFGVPGKEIWFGGKWLDNEKNINNIWDDIGNYTGKKKEDFKKFPFSEHERKVHFISSLEEDVTDEEVLEYQNPGVNDKKEIVFKRCYKIPWFESLKVSPKNIKRLRDKNKFVDLRDDFGFNKQEFINKMRYN